MQRKYNSSLKDFKMIPTLSNVVEYVPKNRYSDLNHLKTIFLETLEGMKRLYQVEAAEQRTRRESDEAQRTPQYISRSKRKPLSKLRAPLKW